MKNGSTSVQITKLICGTLIALAVIIMLGFVLVFGGF